MTTTTDQEAIEATVYSDFMCPACRGKGEYPGLDITCRTCHGSGLESLESRRKQKSAQIDRLQAEIDQIDAQIEEMELRGQVA